MLVWFGTLLMGATLIAGQRYFPDFTIMWFASPDAQMAIWRQALIVALGVSLIVKPYFDNPYLHMIWGLTGAGLLWGGVGYFFDNPAYIFDVMLILAVGVCFMIEALQKIPIEQARDAERAIVLGEWFRHALDFHTYLATPERLKHTYRNVARDDSHVLVIH